MSYALGVDIGTSYTAAAVWEAGRVDMLQLGTRSASIPSVVLLRDDGTMMTGEAAERRAPAEPARAAREFKRRIGDPTPLILGGTPFGAETLWGCLLRAAVEEAARQRGEPPAAIVVTHPASFSRYKLDLLDHAARAADLGTVRLLPEPIAAAIHYASQERVEPGAVLAVYDFGGGTFDASVLRKTPDGFELLGQPEGLERLGGIDFDEAVFRHVLSSLEGDWDGASDPAARPAVQRLRDECREAKEVLSYDTEAVVTAALPGLHTTVRVTREEFERAIAPRIRETVAALERSVRSAGLTMDAVDRVLLVGGTSRIPLVAATVREMTGRPVAVVTARSTRWRWARPSKRGSRSRQAPRRQPRLRRSCPTALPGAASTRPPASHRPLPLPRLLQRSPPAKLRPGMAARRPAPRPGAGREDWCLPVPQPPPRPSPGPPSCSSGAEETTRRRPRPAQTAPGRLRRQQPRWQPPPRPRPRRPQPVPRPRRRRLPRRSLRGRRASPASRSAGAATA
ncbi:Hsp70 family protein [Tepidiforma sp.]|jgi:molecular chaperone DnaK|uniref:Hsp70 family protein n=1 Tax=Tepidiforma sp. TaxID=2682230 RepID=UPI002624AE5C|nr:Hsp70 family protein [Tepidiforma sp.]MCX7617199.1 Hsp70 family protein [Tepidiforma sp.]